MFGLFNVTSATLIQCYTSAVIFCISVLALLLAIYVIYFENISFLSAFFRSDLGREIFFKYDAAAQPVIRFLISVLNILQVMAIWLCLQIHNSGNETFDEALSVTLCIHQFSFLFFTSVGTNHPFAFSSEIKKYIVTELLFIATLVSVSPVCSIFLFMVIAAQLPLLLVMFEENLNNIKHRNQICKNILNQCDQLVRYKYELCIKGELLYYIESNKIIQENIIKVARIQYVSSQTLGRAVYLKDMSTLNKINLSMISELSSENKISKIPMFCYDNAYLIEIMYPLGFVQQAVNTIDVFEKQFSFFKPIRVDNN